MGHLARITRAGAVSSVVALAMGLATVGPASAKTCTKNVAPPGHAGSTQYYETVPTSCGNASPPGGGGNGSPNSSQSINHLGQARSGVRTLSHLGAQGSAAAALAAATAPTPTGGAVGRSSGNGAASGKSGSPTSTSSHGRTPGVSSDLPSVPAGSGSSALSSALTGSGGGGLGVLLPILLGLSLVGAIAAGAIRARRSGGPSV